MYAVFRETHYEKDSNVFETEAFKKFQKKHADQPGYAGTIVSKVGDNRYLTVTLWETEQAMHNARNELIPVVSELLNPLMTSPAKLLGTGPVAVNDVSSNA